MGFITRLFGKKAPFDFDRLIADSREHLAALTAGHVAAWRLGQADRWTLNQDDGNLIFTFADGIVASCPAQIIGTFNAADNSWMWAWNNPSINSSLAQDSLRLREYGEKHGIEKLTTPQWPASEEDAWNMTALACKLCEAQGAYRGPAGTTYVFMTFGKVRLGQADPSGSGTG